MTGPCLPYAAPSDVGAVHHNMSPDAHAIRRTRLFFCQAPGQPKKTNLKIVHSQNLKVGKSIVGKRRLFGLVLFVLPFLTSERPSPS